MLHTAQNDSLNISRAVPWHVLADGFEMHLEVIPLRDRDEGQSLVEGDGKESLHDRLDDGRGCIANIKRL